MEQEHTIESGLESRESDVEQIETQRDDIERRQAELDYALAALEKDEDLLQDLKKNEANLEVDKETLEIKRSDAVQQLELIEAELDKLSETSDQSQSVLNMLQSMGEDVTEGNSILQNRRTWLEECHRRVAELAERLGEWYDEMGKLHEQTQAPGEASVEKEQQSESMEQLKLKRRALAFEFAANPTAYPSDTFGTELQLVQDRRAPSRYFSCGNHYDAFLDFWENNVEYTFSRSETPELVYIRARDIEGVDLNDREVANPESFWTRNGREGYSRENILRKAARIQEVREHMRAGASLEELSRNEELEDTILSYYNRPVEVVQLGEYYVFRDDGRHRTLAAQSLDIYIPVLVTGIYVKA